MTLGSNDYADLVLRFPYIRGQQGVLPDMLLCLAYAHRFVTGALHRELPKPAWLARLDGADVRYAVGTLDQATVARMSAARQAKLMLVKRQLDGTAVVSPAQFLLDHESMVWANLYDGPRGPV